MNGEEKREGVDTISDTSKGQSILDTESVDEGSSKETKDGKCGVESRVLQGKVSTKTVILKVLHCSRCRNMNLSETQRDWCVKHPVY